MEEHLRWHAGPFHQTVEAVEWFDQAVQWTDSALSGVGEDAPERVSWNERLMLQMLREEAERLFLNKEGLTRE